MKEQFKELKNIDFRTLDWKKELQNNITTVKELENYLELTKEERENLETIVKNHPMNIPRYYLSLIDTENPNDPIRKLAIPSNEELITVGDMGETTKDPYGDDKHNKGNGILHKYPYSALIVATEYCSMYCRHCFRKRMVGLENDQTVENFKNAAKYIREHKEIKNVVISGGDPFLLRTDVLKEILNSLRDIEHINYVRIGSRAPVVYPIRFFDDELLEFLTEYNKDKTLFVPTHFNSAKELTPLAKEAINKIRDCGITVNNQAVFLKGVNDSVEGIVKLMDGLTRAGANPYYLYQCMPVERVRHQFQVPLKRGIDIVSEAKKQLDGYGKRFKFIMGHDIGKIEICGRHGDKLVMSQIHARPETPDEASRILIRKLNENGGWLEDLENVENL